MKYGLPYKGSKNKLAERIVRLLPKRTNLVDLFCGGCAVSHAALLMGKYEHIHINDINWMCPTLFIDALNGKYNDENRWISREDFFRLKDTDPYVAVVWSFGNNLRDYLYSKEIEPLKKAIHYAMFFSDYSLGKELGHDLSFIDHIQDLQKRYLAVKHYFNKQGHFRHQSFLGGVRISGCSRNRSAELPGLPQYKLGGVLRGCSQQKQTKGSIHFGISSIGKAVKSSLSKKKIQATQRATAQRRTQHSCIACNTERAAQSAQIFGGGRFYLSHPLCLTTKKSRYLKTA